MYTYIELFNYANTFLRINLEKYYTNINPLFYLTFRVMW